MSVFAVRPCADSLSTSIRFALKKSPRRFYRSPRSLYPVDSSLNPLSAHRVSGRALIQVSATER